MRAILSAAAISCFVPLGAHAQENQAEPVFQQRLNESGVCGKVLPKVSVCDIPVDYFTGGEGMYTAICNAATEFAESVGFDNETWTGAVDKDHHVVPEGGFTFFEGKTIQIKFEAVCKTSDEAEIPVTLEDKGECSVSYEGEVSEANITEVSCQFSGEVAEIFGKLKGFNEIVREPIVQTMTVVDLEPAN